MVAKKFVQFETADFAQKILWLYGVYTGKKYPRRQALRIIFFLHFFLSMTVIMSMTVNAYLHLNDLEVAFGIIHLLLTELVYNTKMFYFMRRLKKVNELEELLESPMFNQHTLKQDHFIVKAISDAKILTNMLRTVSWIAAVAYTICPIIDGNIWMIPIWVPWTDGRPKLVYQMYEGVCFFILASVNPALDVYPVELISIMAGQLDVLNDNIKHATDRDENDQPDIQEAKIKKRLVGCVEHHLAILSFLEQVQQIFSVGLFIQICISVGAICMTGLQYLTISPRSATFYAISIYFVAILLEIGMCCFVGQTIIEKSEEIRDACYTSDWYNCSISIRKMLFIIMERSKRRSIIRAGNFFDLSLNTFVMILRNAYSYFAVLTQLYK